MFDGQSHVASPDYWTGDANFGWSWPRICMAGRELPGYVVGVGGQSLTTLAGSFATRAARHLQSPEPSIYVLCGGNQDLRDNDTAAQVYADAGTLASLARSAGADYVICTTILPGRIPDMYTEAQNTQRLAANSLLMADASGHFDVVVNIVVPGTDDPEDPASYIFDGVHPYGWPASYGWSQSKGTPKIAATVDPYLTVAIAAVS